MILKALSVILLISFNQATPLRYPANQPCILMDLDTENTLAWTDEDGIAQLDTSLKFDSATIVGGLCSKPPSDMPDLVLSWTNGAVMRFDFDNTTDDVMLSWNLRYSPSNIFNTTETGIVTHEGQFSAGHTGMAFTCRKQAPINDDVKSGNNTSKFEMTFKQAKWQAFNVENGQYSSNVEDCEADEQTTVAAQTSEGPTTPKPDEPTSEKPTEKPTSEKPTEKPTSPKPDEPTSEKPTEKPTSEKPTEKPTSEKPTSEKPTEEPTTAPPTVPTTAAPSADPEVNLNGTDKGTTCILLKGKFLFTVTYPKNGTTTPGSVPVGVHDVKSMKGDCNGTMKTNELMITFYNDWTMAVVFGADKATTLLTADDDGDDTFWWQQLNLTYMYDDKIMPDLNTTFQGKSMTVSKTFDKQFKAASDGSYKCNAETEIDLSDGAKLKVSDMQYQAFQKNTTGFPSDNLSECSDDSGTNSVVPIAVGAALAGLVVIVLIAYLIGRKRNRKGYESV